MSPPEEDEGSCLTHTSARPHTPQTLTAVRPQVNVDPEDLIPKLPKPKDLQPFPSTQALVRP